MKLFENIEGFASDCLSLVKTIVSIFKLEAKLARLSIFPLILNLCMLFIIAITVWLSSMFILGYYSALTFNSIIIAAAIVLLINLLSLVLLIQYLKFNLRNLSFEKTRAYFSKKEEKPYEKLEESTNS
jgi:hypothetical protein